MKVGLVTDVAWIVRHYDRVVQPESLVESWGFKIATLSSAFSDVHAVVAHDGKNVCAILPLVRCNGVNEVLGQFWGEGYGLRISAELWPELLSKIEGPVSISCCATKLPGMVEEKEKMALLSLSTHREKLEAYEATFADADSRRTLKQALAWKDQAKVVGVLEATDNDLCTLSALSIARLKGESRFVMGSAHMECFARLVRYLSSVTALQVLRYQVRGELAGIAFFAMDWKRDMVVFLAGHSVEGLDNFGKYMYYSFAELAEKWNLRFVSAMAPMYRIKRDMGYKEKPLYGLER